MIELQKRCTADNCNNVSGEDGGCTDSGDECLNGERTLMALENVETFPYVEGDLQILSLGNFSWLPLFKYLCIPKSFSMSILLYLIESLIY